MEILIFKKLAKEMYYELELIYETTKIISSSGSLIFQNKKFLLSELENILVDRYVLEKNPWNLCFLEYSFIYIKNEINVSYNYRF